MVEKQKTGIINLHFPWFSSKALDEPKNRMKGNYMLRQAVINESAVEE